MSDQSDPGENLAPIRAQRERLANAADDLEQAITSASGDVVTWREQVEDALEELDAALANHIAMTETDDGLYADIVASAPRLINPINRLMHEHADLVHRVDSIKPLVASDPAELQVDLIRDQAFELLSHISLHRSRGAELIYESYAFDIGSSE